VLGAAAFKGRGTKRSAPVSARGPRHRLATRLAHAFARVVTTLDLRKKLLFTLG
jgi:hypothetical protein